MGTRSFTKAFSAAALLAAGAAGFSNDAALAVPPPKIAFDDNVVRATRIRPGGEALLVGISKEHLPFESRLFTYAELLVDFDLDGDVELELDNAVSAGSVWAVADLSSGRWRIFGPERSPMRKKSDRGGIGRDGFGSLKRLMVEGRVLELFVARPGTGAWRSIVGDGGIGDLGDSNDGRIHVDLGRLEPIGTTEEFEALEDGDVIFVLDPRRLEFSAGRVRGDRMDDETDREEER